LRYRLSPQAGLLPAITRLARAWSVVRGLTSAIIPGNFLGIFFQIV